MDQYCQQNGTQLVSLLNNLKINYLQPLKVVNVLGLVENVEANVYSQQQDYHLKEPKVDAIDLIFNH